MTDILKYKVLNPISDKTRPYLQKGILYIPIDEPYRYFVEAAQDNVYGGIDYFLLLGKTKFSPHCRLCQYDMYHRVKVRLKGEIKEYVEDICREEGNINFEYVESAEDYDVFSIG